MNETIDDVIEWATRTSMETLRAVESAPKVDMLSVLRLLLKQCEEDPEGEELIVASEDFARLFAPLVEELELHRAYFASSGSYVRAHARICGNTMPWEERAEAARKARATFEVDSTALSNVPTSLSELRLLRAYHTTNEVRRKAREEETLAFSEVGPGSTRYQVACDAVRRADLAFVEAGVEYQRFLSHG